MSLTLDDSQLETVCVDNGHDWESICVVDSERVDGKKYLVVLTECGKEETRLGDQVPHIHLSSITEYDSAYLYSPLIMKKILINKRSYFRQSL